VLSLDVALVELALLKRPDFRSCASTWTNPNREEECNGREDRGRFARGHGAGVTDEADVRKLVGALGMNTVLTAVLGLKLVAPASKPGPKSGPKPAVPPVQPKV
jgi:hypothetical protein